MLENPGRRRSSTPHIVAPTIHSLRDSMIGSSIASSQRLSSSYINDNNIINENSGLLATHEEEVESGYHDTNHISFDATTSDSLGKRRPLLYRQLNKLHHKYLLLSSSLYFTYWLVFRLVLVIFLLVGMVHLRKKK